MGARTLVAGRVKLLGAGQCVNVNGEVAARMRPLLGLYRLSLAAGGNHGTKLRSLKSARITFNESTAAW
jgi:hypothetical protein